MSATLNLTGVQTSYVVWTGLALVLLSCAQPSKSKTPVIPEFHFHAVASKEEWGEHGFIAQVGCMAYLGDRLFLSDYTNHRMLVLDKNFGFIASIGSAGQGPGELVGAGFFAIYQDSIYIYNEGGRKLEAFTKTGEFLESVSCSINAGASRFLISDDIIYMSTPWTEQPITAYTLKGEQAFAFGNFREKPTLMQRNAANITHLTQMVLADRPRIISVLKGDPFIDIYSLEGQLLNTLDLSSNEYIRRRILFREAKIKEDPASQEGTFIFFPDVYVENSRLFLLVTGENGGETNKIFRIRLDEKEAVIECILTLDHDQPFFGALSFCVGPDESVFLFENVSDQLYRYVKSGADYLQ